MMDGAQQSDAAVVARKAANKGARVPAEPLERRAAAERNPRRTGTVRTQSRGAVSPGAERIRQFAEQPGFHESRLIRKADVAASLRHRSFHESRLIRKADVAASLRHRSNGASRLRLWSSSVPMRVVPS